MVHKVNTQKITDCPTDWTEQLEILQNLLLAHATGSRGNDGEYRTLRQAFVDNPRFTKLLPSFVRTCRTLAEFWAHIKAQYDHYAGRRTYIWESFRPLFDFIEKNEAHPSDSAVTDTLESLSDTEIRRIWSKALERRSTDAEGAITVARTLLESTCKCILDDLNISYEEGLELPKLYKLTAESLNLAPGQHNESIFRQILGGCTAVVEGLGTMRNRLSDSHGKGKASVRPASRHAELAVNLAGSVSAFLFATWKVRKD